MLFEGTRLSLCLNALSNKTFFNITLLICSLHCTPQEIGLAEALCGFHRVIDTLDKRKLVITSHPGEVIKPSMSFAYPLNFLHLLLGPLLSSSDKIHISCCIESLSKELYGDTSDNTKKNCKDQARVFQSTIRLILDKSKLSCLLHSFIYKMSRFRSKSVLLDML